ncbi:MAG TPA: S26 family signal peptidase [Vitreimonas sp.]|uniref:S26 family signal peptidase n=1 Tax=Vitreimonas sp. TaxID=3069702 RepID=UPI002D3E96EB|nr:S26 family signal peptidase [Vitreimonas sp.]HYD86730.1 S26 family signal peptidase [Vitreimonas sp.]
MAAALAAAALAAPRDLLIYNHSPSVPEGFYVRTSAPIAVDAFVTVRARDVAPQEAHRRGFDDASDRFIKRVAAAAGAHVCGDGQRLTITGDDRGGREHIAVRVILQDRDDDTRRPVGWRGCRTLAASEVLLLGDSDDSFDGRYWGPVSVDLIEGVWRKL